MKKNVSFVEIYALANINPNVVASRWPRPVVKGLFLKVMRYAWKHSLEDLYNDTREVYDPSIRQGLPGGGL